ncbi:hypothetical protein [Planococcus sp. ISL-110]|nr:hypothetical protein [Planococcus sp. ISL-110]
MKELQFSLICVYASQSMSEAIKTMLLETHPYILVEDDVIVSALYIATES